MLLHTGRSSLFHAASHQNLSIPSILRPHRAHLTEIYSSLPQRHVRASAQARVESPEAVPVHPEIGEVLFSETDLHQVVARLGR